MRDPVTMRVAQIRAELKERNIPFSDCFDKDGLVDRLRAARAGLVRPMEVRPPAAQNAVRPPPAVYDHVYDQRGAGKGDFEFGAESRQGAEDDPNPNPNPNPNPTPNPNPNPNPNPSPTPNPTPNPNPNPNPNPTPNPNPDPNPNPNRRPAS